MRGFQPAGEKAPAKKSAGPVRGPGTGTSDEVQQQVQDGTYIMPTDSTEAIGEQALAAMGKGEPVDVNLSNGEFKMPPEQVHAIGVQALDQMKAATHTPAQARGLPAPAQAPGEPPMFFAEGGEVDKDKPSYPSPTNIFPGNRLPGTSGSTSAPAAPAAVAAPTAAAPAAPAAAAPVKRSVELATQLQGLPAPQFQRDIAQRQALEGQIQRAQTSERYDSAGAQMAAEAREAATMRMNRAANRPLAPAALPPSTGAAALAAHDAGGAGGGRGFVNPPLVSPPAAAPAAAAPPAAPVPPPATAPAAAAVPPQTAAHEYGPPASAAPPAAAQVMPGVYRAGNSYGDSAQAAIAGAAPRGLPTPDAMAAADALAQRSQQASAGRVAAAAPVERGWSGVIGTDPAAGRERRELVASLTTPMKGAQNGQLTAAQRNGMLSLLDQEARGAQAKANNATALQQTEMQTGTQRDLATMREAGDNGRAVLREAGETNRAGARNSIDQGRLGLEKDVRGFDIRAGQRQERLHQRYEAAKTPEERSAIAQQIRDLAGKPNESPWKLQVTPATKNADGSTTEGSIYRYNGQTGQVERADGGTGNQASPYTDGQRLKGKDGKDYVVRNGRPEPI